MKQDVSERFETIEAALQDSVMAQEQVTEELNRFQEAFEELIKQADTSK